MTTALNPSNRPTVVLRADAALLTGQADGSPLSGTGFGGFAPDASYAEPTYHAAGIGGQPSLSFNGTTQRLALAHGVNAALDAALASGASWTIQVVYQLPAPATGVGSIFGQAGGGAGPWITTASNNQIVVQDGTGGNGGSRFRGPAAGVPAIIQVSFDATSGITTYGNCDGSTFSYHQTQSGGSTAYSLGIAEDGGFQFTGQVRAVVVDNACLTPSQLAADQAYWRATFAPSVVAAPCDGDSRTKGTDTSSNPGVSGNTSPYPYPLQLQGLLGSGYDVTNNGNPGIATAGIAYPAGIILTQTTSALNPLRHKLAAVPILLSVNDWIGGTVTAPQAAANVAGGVQFLQQQSPIPIGFLLMTELDSGYQNHEASWLTYRSSYVTNLKALLPPTTGVYEYLDTAADAHIGVAGSYANSAYYSPDALHLVGEDSSGNEGGGYGYLAGLVAPALQALVGHMIALAAGSGSAPAATGLAIQLGAPSGYTGQVIDYTLTLTGGTTLAATLNYSLAGLPGGTQTGTMTSGTIQVIGSFTVGSAGTITPALTITGGNGGMTTSATPTTFTAQALPSGQSAAAASYVVPDWPGATTAGQAYHCTAVFQGGPASASGSITLPAVAGVTWNGGTAGAAGSIAVSSGASYASFTASFAAGSYIAQALTHTGLGFSGGDYTLGTSTSSAAQSGGSDLTYQQVQAASQAGCAAAIAAANLAGGQEMAVDSATVLGSPAPQRLTVSVSGLTLPAGNAVGMTLVYQSGATSGAEPSNGRVGGVVSGHAVSGSGSGRYDTLSLSPTTVPSSLVAPVAGETLILLPTPINPG